jgi:hypothetical protein
MFYGELKCLKQDSHKEEAKRQKRMSGMKCGSPPGRT